MRVQPSLQRRGLGWEMLLALEQRAAALGFRTLTLATTVGQVAAMEMYVKAAYQEVRRYRHAGFDIVAFEKHIQARGEGALPTLAARAGTDSMGACP